jgi:hypothetical protein
VRNSYNIFIGKPEGKIPRERSSSRWEDNIRTDLREIRWEGVYWMRLAQEEPVTDLFERGIKPSGEFLDQLTDC